MFLRKKRSRVAGETYEYWSLYESVRTARGPRQRVVACLGKLDEEEVRQGGWEDIESLLKGERAPKSRQMALGEEAASPAPRWEKVDIGAVSVERVREFGSVYLPLALWHRLGLGQLLAEVIEPGREAVDWPSVASVLVGARFCAQASELSIAEGWYEKTALEDILGVEKGRINDDRLYRALDVPGRHKEKLCAHLMERYRDWFGVRMMEEKYGAAERIWVMDRGMVSEANIAFLRDRKALYIVGTPKSELRHFEAALLEEQNWTEVQDGLEARLVEHPDGQGSEKYVLCRSTVRAEKERAMLARQSENLALELSKIHAWLERSPQSDREKVGRRIGRVLGKYPGAARILEAHVRYDAAARACALHFFSNREAGQKAHLRRGAYLLRTNCEETDPALLWRWYIQHIAAEAAFRTAKSDLGLRPIFHHLESRVDAHILVCFLALTLWRTLEQWMSAKGLGTCARKLIDAVTSIKSMDVILPVERHAQRLDLRLRVVAKPEKDTALLLAHLGLKLPRRAKIIENVVPKIPAYPHRCEIGLFKLRSSG